MRLQVVILKIALWAEGILGVIQLIVVYVKRHGMKPYIMLWLFAAWFSDWIGILGTQHLHYWKYTGGIFYGIGLWFIGDDIIIPTFAMLAIRYWPTKRNSAWLYVLLWTVSLTGLEYLAERYTELLKYENGYDWYYSFFVWLFSVIVWRLFHSWWEGNNVTA